MRALLAIALVGLASSLALHVATFADVAPGTVVVAAFLPLVVVFPAAVAACPPKDDPQRAGGDLWDMLPRPAAAAAGVFAIYAAGVFGWVIVADPAEDSPAVMRLMTAWPVLFYVASATMLLGGLRRADRQRRSLGRLPADAPRFSPAGHASVRLALAIVGAVAGVIAGGSLAAWAVPGSWQAWVAVPLVLAGASAGWTCTPRSVGRWAWCPACGDRATRVRGQGGPVAYRCVTCGHRERLGYTSRLGAMQTD